MVGGGRGKWDDGHRWCLERPVGPEIGQMSSDKLNVPEEMGRSTLGMVNFPHMWFIMHYANYIFHIRP